MAASIYVNEEVTGVSQVLAQSHMFPVNR